MVWYVAVATHKLPHAIIFCLLLLLLLLIAFFFHHLSFFSMYYVCFVRLGFVVEGTGINGCVEQNRSRQAEVRAAFNPASNPSGSRNHHTLEVGSELRGWQGGPLTCLLIGELWGRVVDREYT